MEKPFKWQFSAYYLKLKEGIAVTWKIFIIGSSLPDVFSEYKMDVFRDILNAL